MDGTYGVCKDVRQVHRKDYSSNHVSLSYFIFSRDQGKLLTRNTPILQHFFSLKIVILGPCSDLYSPSRSSRPTMPPFMATSLRCRITARVSVIKKMTDGKINCPIQNAAKPVQDKCIRGFPISVNHGQVVHTEG